MGFNDAQKEAITARNKSLVVSASAGSGKTTVLVERIIRLVCDEGVELERLVVVTFTNAAAAGIKARLRNALKERLAKDPENRHIRKQLLNLNSANISTVHSFCGKMIKKYNYLLSENIPVNFKLLNETDEYLLLKDCLDEILDEYYESDNEAFENFMESYSPGRSDADLSAMILNIYKDFCCVPFYSERIREMKESLSGETDFFKTPFAAFLSEYIERMLKGIISKYELACDYVRNTEGLENQIQTYTGELEAIRKLLLEKDLEVKLRGLREFEFEKLSPAKRGTDTTLSAGVRGAVKKAVEKINNSYFDFSPPSESDRVKINVFFEIIEKLDERYKSSKYENGCISFSDQEHLTIEILSNDEISEELKAYYHEIMVDEFQDTNDIQDYIFSRISRKDNLFVVGDVKQCIYQFRHSNPSIFTSKIKKAGIDPSSEVIYLNTNYRSTVNVAETVNLVMSYIMHGGICDTDYYKTDMLIPADSDNSSPKYNTELILCDIEAEDGGVSVPEATAVAERIKNLMDDGDFYGNGSERTVRYSDIAILVRGFGSKVLEMLECLTEQGIPCRYDDKINIFDTPEVKQTLALLRAIDNPTDDISLIATVRNIFGLSDEEIFEMRENNPQGGFYEITSKERPDITDKLKSLSSYAAKYGINSLMEKIFDDYLIPEKWAAMGGTGRYDNLRMLLNLSYEFGQSGFKGISSFVTYIDKIINSGKKMMMPDLGGGKDDYVRVMTVHKSKGLEFPIVILAGFGNKINKKDLSASIMTESSLGIGYNLVDVAGRFRYPSVYKKVIAEKKLHDMLCEEVRVLYVALTRAEYKIIITASVKDSLKALRSYSQKTYNGKFEMAYSDFMSASAIPDILVPPLLFSESMSGVGTAIPDQAPELKKAGIELVCSYNKSADVLNELSDGELIKGLIYGTDKTKKYNIFTYSGNDGGIPGKISVTALNNLKENDTAITGPYSSYELYEPDFSDKGKLSAAQRGTLVHLVLEKIDLEAINKSGDVLAEIMKLLKSNEIFSDNLTLDDAAKIESFLTSPLGIKLRKSPKVYREKEFLMFMDSSEIFGGDAERKIMVQGIIDLCFEDNNGMILVDYKLASMPENKIKETYRYQLELYKYALSKLFNVDFSRINAYIWDINRCISYKM